MARMTASRMAASSIAMLIARPCPIDVAPVQVVSAASAACGRAHEVPGLECRLRGRERRLGVGAPQAQGRDRVGARRSRGDGVAIARRSRCPRRRPRPWRRRSRRRPRMPLQGRRRRQADRRRRSSRSSRAGRGPRSPRRASGSRRRSARPASRRGSARGSVQSPASPTTCVVARAGGGARIEQRQVLVAGHPGPPQVVEAVAGSRPRAGRGGRASPAAPSTGLGRRRPTAAGRRRRRPAASAQTACSTSAPARSPIALARARLAA